MQEAHNYVANTGAFAQLNDEEKRKRLDAMVQLWQHETERRLARDGYESVIKALGLDEYRYAVWLRFPEWERAVVAGQVVAFPQTATQAVQDEQQPTLFSTWRRDALLKTLPDWKLHLPRETVFNIT
ncbi:MAG TPA: hypothetical protein VHZ51_07175, partial [Ktedonobacteraceae bacterium]|nr:hypothetical protein [Ktedonobacteraceae bacterium]